MGSFLQSVFQIRSFLFSFYRTLMCFLSPPLYYCFFETKNWHPMMYIHCTYYRINNDDFVILSLPLRMSHFDFLNISEDSILYALFFLEMVKLFSIFLIFLFSGVSIRLQYPQYNPNDNIMYHGLF